MLYIYIHLRYSKKGDTVMKHLFSNSGYRILSLIVVAAVILSVVPISAAAENSLPPDSEITMQSNENGDEVEIDEGRETAPDDDGFQENDKTLDDETDGDDITGNRDEQDGGSDGGGGTLDDEASENEIETENDGEVSDSDDTNPPADNIPLGYSITAFAALADVVANQSVTVGAGLEDLTLPDSLDATVSDGEDEIETEITGVTWQSEPEFAAVTIGGLEIVPVGTYVFTPALPEGYAVADGVTLPAITVEVQPVGILPMSAVTNITTSTTLADGDAISGTIGQAGQSITVTVNSGDTVTVTGTLTCSGNVTITGGGTILRDSGFKGNMITIPSGSALKLSGVTINGNGSVVTATTSTINANSGTLVMEDGAVIQNCADSAGNAGGAVNLRGNAVFTMNSGKITYNKSTSYGGAVYIYTGCVFTMNSGEITNNSLTESSPSYGGGGVYNRGTCVINSGTISGNNGVTYGGGVYNSSYGTLTINGGTITGNIAEKGEGIFHSSRTANQDALLEVGGGADIQDNIYLDVTTGFKYVVFTSQIKNTMTLVLPSPAENLVIGEGTGSYALTKADMQKILIVAAGQWYPKLTDDNKFVLTVTDPGYGSYYYVSYDSNGGSGIVTDDTGYSPGGTVTLKSGAALSNPPYSFAGWQYGGTVYQPGQAFTMPDSNVFFTAVWADTTAPVLSGGTVNRTSDTAATIGFTTNEAGTYYYQVDGSAPTAGTLVLSGTSGAMSNNGNTINLSGLAAGAHTVYIAAKDAAGNVSNMLTIPVPAFVVNVDGVSLNKTSITINAGGYETLIATVSPSNATNKTVSWSSSNTSVATVSGGVVTAAAPGTATITVTTADGSKTAECTVTVTGTISHTATGYNGTYDGNSHGITVTVSSPAGTTVKYRADDSGDYTLTENPAYTNAGTYTVYYQITKDYYTTVTGSATVTISQAMPSVTRWPTAAAITYGQALKDSALSGGAVSVTGTFAWTIPETAPNAGDARYNVIFTPADDNYKTVTGSVTVTVNKADNTLVITCPDITFGGTVSPNVETNTSNGAVTYEYKANGAYDSAYSAVKPTAVGNYTVRGTSAATANYNAATATADFSIGKAYPTVNWPADLTAVYGQTLNDVTLPNGNGAGTPGTFSWAVTSAFVGGKGANQHSLIFTPSDKDSYETLTALVNVAVSPRSISNAAIAAIPDQTYTGSAIEPVPDVSDGSIMITENDYTVSYSDDHTNIGTVTVTLEGRGNYTGTNTNAATFTIVAARLNGTPDITGTVKIGGTLSVDATSLNAHGDAGTSLTYQWKVGGTDVGTNSDTYTVQGFDAGKDISVTVTAAGNYTGSTTSDTVTVPYTVVITGHSSDGDSVTEQIAYKEADETVSIAYTLANTHIENKLVFRANGTVIATITTPDTSTQSYTISAAHADSNGKITITADFSHTSVLMSADAAVAAPANGETPQDSITPGNHYAATISWNGEPSVFLGDTIYTATITLTATGNATFSSNFVLTVNGSAATKVSVSGATAEFTYTFPKTPAKAISGISVKTQPKLVYVAGDKLDLSSLVIKVTYDDTSTEDIAYDESGVAYTVGSGDVKSGTTIMKKLMHDSNAVIVTYGDKSTNTSDLTVYTIPALQISVADIAATTAKISYKAIGDSRNNTTSTLQVRNGSAWADVPGASSPHMATSLTPDTAYEYRVWAKDDTTDREYTSSVTFRTAVSVPAGITVDGTVTDPSNPSSITVTIEHGNTVIASVAIVGSRTYNFSFSNIPNGVYNLVSDNGSYKVTRAVTVSGADVRGIQIDMSGGNTQSVVDIVTGDTPPAAVDGLPKLFEDDDIYKPEDKAVVAANGTVEIKLAVEKQDAPADAEKIDNAASGQTVSLYLDLSIIKSQFDDTGVLLDEAKLTNLNGNLITITFELPDDLKGKSSLTVYRVHNGVTEALTSTPNADGETAVISGGFVTLCVCKFSTYAVAYTPENTNRNPSSNGGGSSSGGGSGVSGGASSTVVSTYWIELAEAKTMAKTAKEKELDYVRSRRASITGIRENALRALIGLRYRHDTVEGKTVWVRVYVDDPAKATKDILVSGYVKGNIVDTIKAKFGKWFTNKVAVVSFDQQGHFGMKVQVAARTDLSGMDTSNLYFYGYDRKTNKYSRINTEYRIDGNGYLHFATILAGDIIVSNGSLTKKADEQIAADGDKYYYLSETPNLERLNLDGGDSMPDFSEPQTQEAPQNPTTEGEFLPYMNTADTPLTLEKVNNSGGEALVIDLDASVTQDALSDSLKRDKVSVYVVIGITVVILLAAMALWAIIPRKGDPMVSVEEYRKKH